MDAREAQKWLESKLKERALLEAENKLQGKVDRAPISELEVRKLFTLLDCRFGQNKDAQRFVFDMLEGNTETIITRQITRNQSEYIEILWERYRNQHKYEVKPPFTDIIRFNQGLPTRVTECNPENEPYTIIFHDNGEESFF